MGPVPATLVGGGSTVTCPAVTVHMELSAGSFVTVFMLTAAIPSVGLVAVWLDGQVSGVTVCVRQVTGGPTVHPAVHVRTEVPAHQRTEHVYVPLDTEAHPVDAVVLLGSTAIAAASPAPSVFIVTVPATTLTDTVNVYLDISALSATKCVPVAGMVQAVPPSVSVPITEPVTLSMDPANACLAGSEKIAPTCVRRVRGGQTVSIPVTVITELSAALQMENVPVA